jgi:hypothetical protein
MGLLTFDWGQISTYTGSPLTYPWWSAANTGLCIMFFYWFLLPILYVRTPFIFTFALSELLSAVQERLVQCLPSLGVLKIFR